MLDHRRSGIQHKATISATSSPQPYERYLESTKLLSNSSTPANFEVEEVVSDGHGVAGGSIWGSTFNLCNSAIGAGILALPYAVKETGLGLGLILILAMALVCCFTLKLIVWANRLHPEAKSYEKLVEHLFGGGASILVTISVILTTFGACAGFLVIIGDLLTPMVGLVVKNPDWFTPDTPHFTYGRVLVTGVVSVIGVLPLASLKSFNSLRFSSTLAIISVTFTVGVIILRSVQNLPVAHFHENVEYFKVGVMIFDALPLITFAFGCHMQVVPIFAELKDNHEDSRVNWFVISTNFVCLTLYSLTGGFGYVRFYGNTEGNILNNFPEDDILVNIARAVLSFVIVCHYPPSNYCCRVALDYLFFRGSKPSTPRRLVWTVLIWGLAFVVAITVPHIDIVFGLIGATANSLIVLIFPAAFLLHCRYFSSWEGPQGFFADLLGCVILFLGVFLTLFGTFIIIMKNYFEDELNNLMF